MKRLLLVAVVAAVAVQCAMAQRRVVSNNRRNNNNNNNNEETRLGLLAQDLGISPVPGGNPGTGGIGGGLVTPNIPPRDTGCWCQPVNQVCTNLRPVNLDLVTRIINRPGTGGTGGTGGAVPTCGQDRRLCCAQPGTLLPGQSGPLTSQCGASQQFGVPAAVSPTADFGEYPFIAVVMGPGQSYVAGGVLISSDVVLTAAHKLSSPTGLTVRLGDYDVSQANDVPQYPHFESAVVDVLIHPGFNPGTIANDVALLQLAQPVNPQRYPHVAPASLPRPGEVFAGQRCFVAGWGRNAFDQGSFQSLLQEVDVPIIDSDTCQNLLRNTRLGPSFVLDRRSFICAGGEKDKDSCQGDGGSPLVCCTGPQSWTVVGLVAWGVGCGQENVPGVYVNIPSYSSFIAQSAGLG